MLPRQSGKEALLRQYFISQHEGMTKSPVETLEKAIVLHLFWTEGLKSFDTSRGALSSLLQKVAMPDSS